MLQYSYNTEAAVFYATQKELCMHASVHKFEFVYFVKSLTGCKSFEIGMTLELSHLIAIKRYAMNTHHSGYMDQTNLN